MLTLLKLAARNLLRNRRRTLATASSLAVALAALYLLTSFVRGIERYLADAHVYALHVGHLAIYKADGLAKHSADPEGYGLTAADQDVISRVLAGQPSVERWYPQLRTSGLISNGCKGVPYRALGVPLDALRFGSEALGRREVTAHLGRPRQGEQLWRSDASVTALALSQGLAEELGKTRARSELAKKDADITPVLPCEGPDIRRVIAEDANVQLLARTFSGNFSAEDAFVTNIFTWGLSEFEADTLVTSLDTLRRLHDSTAVSSVAVFLKDASNIQERAQAVRKALEATGLRADVYPWSDVAVSPNYAGPRQFLRGMTLFVCAVIVLVVAVSILSTASMMVLERQREIGTLRSLGFTRSLMRRMFAAEIGMIVAVGAACGLLLGTLSSAALSQLKLPVAFPGLVRGVRLEFVPWPSMILAEVVVITLCALIGTAVAAQMTLRRRIGVLLRAT